MFGFTTILGLALFHTSAERQVAVKQRTVAAFANRRQCELQVLHSNVIIAKRDLLVNRLANVFQRIKQHYLVVLTQDLLV